MSVPRNMLKELLERKLWPIALVLVIALVAVPVLLTKKAPTDIVTPPTGPLPYSSGTTLPAISVQTSPGSSNLAGKGRNPFTPQHVATTSTIVDHDPGDHDPDHGREHGHDERRQRQLEHRQWFERHRDRGDDPRNFPDPDPDHARADDEAQAGADRADGDRVLPRVARAHRSQRQSEHDLTRSSGSASSRASSSRC